MQFLKQNNIYFVVSICLQHKDYNLPAADV